MAEAANTNTAQGTGLGQDTSLGQQNTSTNPSELDSAVPSKASEAPLSGIEPAEGVSFGDQVKGHAKMFAGKTFGNDKEVQQGAAKVRGLEEQQQK